MNMMVRGICDFVIAAELAVVFLFIVYVLKERK